MLEALHIIDGDTVRHQLYGAIRLTGYNTPEIHGKCPDESRLAIRAKVRLQQLAKEPSAELILSGKFCAWGRRCGIIQVNGKNVGEVLIAEGLAERYECKGNKCPKRRNWCQPQPHPQRPQ